MLARLQFCNTSLVFLTGKHYLNRFSCCNSARVSKTSQVHESVRIGSFTVILDNVKIGERTSIGSCCVIGPDVSIGADCNISNNVTLSNCNLDDRVTILPGVRVGQDGFGFALQPENNESDGPVRKKPQTLRVRIENDVEIGANATIDRGSWRDTVIGEFTKLDNQVHIAHNVVIGRACLIAAQSGIAGSCNIGEYSQLGGQVGVAQHLDIGARSMVAGKSGVINNLKGGEAYGGTPAVPIRQWHRQSVHLARAARHKP